MERNGSTKTLWKELKQEQGMMVNLRDREGKIETDRRKIIRVASEFYENLYGRDEDEERGGGGGDTQNRGVGGRKRDQEVEDRKDTWSRQNRK